MILPQELALSLSRLHIDDGEEVPGGEQKTLNDIHATTTVRGRRPFRVLKRLLRLTRIAS